MKVSEIVFACWDKTCAPPPAGKGGSRKGSAHSLRTRKRADAKYRSKVVRELKKRAESAHATSGAKYKMGKPGEHSPGPSARVKALTDKYGTRRG